nr:MAG TPA: hypothetical protein [Caudoviricetes sp.]
MTDKEIVLELTKAVLTRQPENYNVLVNYTSTGNAVVKIFNTIANGIKPTLDKLATQCEKQAHNS